MAETSKRKRIPLGPPLARETLMSLSKITRADVRAARVLWRLHAPPKYRRLLDAIGAKVNDATDRTA